MVARAVEGTCFRGVIRQKTKEAPACASVPIIITITLHAVPSFASHLALSSKVAPLHNWTKQQHSRLPERGASSICTEKTKSGHQRTRHRQDRRPVESFETVSPRSADSPALFSLID